MGSGEGRVAGGCSVGAESDVESDVDDAAWIVWFYHVPCTTSFQVTHNYYGQNKQISNLRRK